MLDLEGYLLDPADWTEAFAEEAAQDMGLSLNPLQWQIIRFTRDYYLTHHSLPKIRLLLKIMREDWGITESNSILLQQLFPPAAMRQIAKLAGLPKPKHCV